MITKIRKKIWGINYAIDIIEFSEDILTLKGWIFSPKDKLENIQFIISSQKHRFPVKLKSNIKRNDVYQTFRFRNSKKCGFYGQVFVENIAQFKVWLSFTKNGRKYSFCIGKLKGNIREKNGIPPRVSLVESPESGINFEKLLDEQQKNSFHFQEELYSEWIDIIVPVYNGYAYLGKLLETIPKTKMKYRLILVNDKSTDPRVDELLEDYAKGKENVILLNNTENLGFVKSVNRGFKISQNHIALVNTDVELPNMWLERLMYPILTDPKVASSTPYTNCGVICSFPNFGEDNKLFLGLGLQEIDDEFSKIPPIYESMPTGVGFCMGMNHAVLKKIGVFDDVSFEKGYGEENDWCQRAIEQGYKNVQVENLFVYHKHGGSFQDEDKKRYIEEHGKVLIKKHPYYNKDVSKFCRLDPNKGVREFVKLNLLKAQGDFYTVFAFDHALGGGATKYLSDKKERNLEEGRVFGIVRYDFVQGCYIIQYYFGTYEMKFHVKELAGVFRMIDYVHVDEVWINEAVTYPDLYHLLDEVGNIKQKNRIYVKMLIHDFFAVCPTAYLLNDKDQYCGIPEFSECNNCLKKAKNLQSLEYKSIQKWRAEWQKFLSICDEVVAFSDNSKLILEKAFGKLDNIVVHPHHIPYIPVVDKKYKTTDSLNIGLLGNLTKHKGLVLIKCLIEKIEKEKLNIRIKLIGNSANKFNSQVFSETGQYTRESLPKLILENDIDIFLISSICPETFSYTTEEIMKMKMPVMCFDIGAPAERVRRYDQGIIIPEMTPEAILKVIQNDKLVGQCMEKEKRNKKVLFVVEEITFSSRYRVEHLREQLLHQGIRSKCVTIDEAYKVDLRPYCTIVVYRSSNAGLVRKLVKNAHGLGKKVYYDIDDYIFNYTAICNLKFLQGSDYSNFDQYSNNIRKAMELCDGFIVSTTNLKSAVQKDFHKKEVFINRNVASMEMLTLSLGVHKKREDNIIRLGYFSGSKTHNEDFEQIKDEILFVMKNNPNVYLYIGGQIELTKDFNCVKDRVEKFDFVSWRKLPQLIAKADINLMPLEGTFFHACKSENKWMEAALVNVPTVASWNTELAGAIEDGVTGFLCKEQSEWRLILQKLIDDINLRSEIAKAAHEKVLQHYNTFGVEPEIVKILLDERTDEG